MYAGQEVFDMILFIITVLCLIFLTTLYLSGSQGGYTMGSAVTEGVLATFPYYQNIFHVFSALELKLRTLHFSSQFQTD